MSALEHEIIEKFRRLQPAAQQRVRALIEQETAAAGAPATFDYEGWFHTVEMLYQQIHAAQGDTLPPLDGVGMLRDIREGEDE